ncbi:MAG: hypothetical protein H0X42_01845 [Solirubrobacterales bacterium]|nr:hypothetical protein [Solirubrobacterales bacterium]
MMLRGDRPGPQRSQEAPPAPADDPNQRDWWRDRHRHHRRDRTAVGTLFLGAATFGSTRSANRAARVAERSLLLGLRPVLTPSRREDPDEKIIYGDGREFLVSAGGGLIEQVDDVVYLAIPLRNVGAGLAVLQRYDVITDNPVHEADPAAGARRPRPARSPLRAD